MEDKSTDNVPIDGEHDVVPDQGEGEVDDQPPINRKNVNVND